MTTHPISFTKGINKAIEVVENMKDLTEIMQVYDDGSQITRDTGLLRKEDIIKKLKKWRQ